MAIDHLRILLLAHDLGPYHRWLHGWLASPVGDVRWRENYRVLSSYKNPTEVPLIGRGKPVYSDDGRHWRKQLWAARALGISNRTVSLNIKYERPVCDGIYLSFTPFSGVKYQEEYTSADPFDRENSKHARRSKLTRSQQEVVAGGVGASEERGEGDARPSEWEDYDGGF